MLHELKELSCVKMCQSLINKDHTDQGPVRDLNCVHYASAAAGTFISKINRDRFFKFALTTCATLEERGKKLQHACLPNCDSRSSNWQSFARQPAKPVWQFADIFLQHVPSSQLRCHVIQYDLAIMNVRKNCDSGSLARVCVCVCVCWASWLWKKKKILHSCKN